MAQLRIRDESELVERKALQRQSKNVPRKVDVSIDDLARDAFFFYYVARFSKVLDVLGFFFTRPNNDRHLHASIKAASLAFFSFQNDSPRARLLAREQYQRALPQVNRALKVPKTASKDSTLLAVLLLDLFEKIMDNNPRPVESWMSHVNGALTLVKLRGPSNFKERTSLRLTAWLCTNVVISCVAASTRVPPVLVQIRSDLEAFLDRYDPKWQLTGLVIDYVNLQSDIQESCLPTCVAIDSIVDLDHQFRDLADGMPSTWQFRTVTLEKPSQRAFDGRVDISRDYSITQTWNVLRVMRILLNDTLRKQSTGLPHEEFSNASSKHIKQMTGIIHDLAKDICASLHQYTYSKDTRVLVQFSMTERVRLYSLIFPLYVAAVFVDPSTQIRSWVMEQLCYLSETAGIRQARVVWIVLDRGYDYNPWSIYALLGSYAFAA